jgi:hypothetical protein
MVNYLYGVSTTVFVTILASMIDHSIPNSLGYYVQLYLPF